MIVFLSEGPFGGILKLSEPVQKNFVRFIKSIALIVLIAGDASERHIGLHEITFVRVQSPPAIPHPAEFLQK